MKKEGKLINIRALAILSVVFSHSVIIYSKGWDLYSSIHKATLIATLKNIIGYYQMPLFFSLSGYLFYYTCQKNKGFFKFVWDKFKRVIIPFVSITLLWVIPVKMLLDVPGFVNESYFRLALNSIFMFKSTGHLWFLISLFVIFVVYYLLNKVFKIYIKDKKHFILDGILLIITAYAAYKNSYFKTVFASVALQRVFIYFFWFYLGFLINKYLALGKKEDSYKCQFVPYLTFFTGAMVMLRLDNGSAIIKLLCTTAILFSVYYVMPSKTNKITEYLDRNSMGIYLFHSVFVYISFTFYPNINPIFMLLINFIGFGFISSIMAELVRKTPFKFILGE